MMCGFGGFKAFQTPKHIYDRLLLEIPVGMYITEEDWESV